jgi:hypothetical protein
MIFGSHLYGCQSESSDKDCKGIFLPSFSDCVLNNIPKSFSKSSGNDKTKNTKDDIDEEIFSLQYFIELACQGQTAAIDMIHCPDELLIESSEIWNFIRTNRSKFYTKTLDTFVKYCRSQAAKYGIKGSRLAAVEQVLEFCKTVDQSLKLKDIWEELPRPEHVYYIQSETGIDFYQVCGKKLQSTIKIKQAVDILDNFYNEYGERARLAKFNDSIDWKSMSHAVRAALQVKEILLTNDLIFPLKDNKLLLDIKQGKLDYKSEVAPMLENLMEEVEILSEKSTFPNKVDRDFWNNFIIDVYRSK